MSDCKLDDFALVNDYIVRDFLPEVSKKNDNSLFGNADITKAFKALIKTLENELKVEITDRKLIKLYKLIMMQAYLFNGSKVSLNNFKLLAYSGNNFKEMNQIKGLVTDYLERIYMNEIKDFGIYFV